MSNIKSKYYLPNEFYNIDINNNSLNFTNKQYLYNILNNIINIILYDKKKVLIIDYNYVINIININNQKKQDIINNICIYLNNKLLKYKYDYIILIINNNSIKINQIEHILNNIYSNISIIRYTILNNHNISISDDIYQYINNILQKNNINCNYINYYFKYKIKINKIKGYNILIYNDNSNKYEYYIKLNNYFY